VKYTTLPGEVKDRSRIYVSYRRWFVRRVMLVIGVKSFERSPTLYDVRSSHDPYNWNSRNPFDFPSFCDMIKAWTRKSQTPKSTN
jgi:hypothetical protein